MKKCASFFLCLCLLFGLAGVWPVSAAGSLSASASSSQVTIGNSVTITLSFNGGGQGIGSLDATLSYNAAAFQYESCEGVTGNGGAGVVTMSYFASGGTPSQTVTAKIKLKAIAPGGGNFTAKTAGMWNDNDELLGTPEQSLNVSAINPTKSGNANLASLKPSSGTLTPAFNANTVNYTINVPNGTTSLNLSATPAHGEAKTAISGSNTLQVGKNTRVITVTAANGTQKKYTVVINRAQAASTTTGTPTQPVSDILEVSVDGNSLTIKETQAEAPLPAGFQWDVIDFKGLQIAAAKSAAPALTLLYLTNPTDNTGAYYIYQAEDDRFIRFQSLLGAGNSYTLLAPPEDMQAPTGTALGTLTYAETETIPAFLYTDEALADYAIVYAARLNAQEGAFRLYTYDRVEGTLQRYYGSLGAQPTDTALTPAEEPSGFMAFIANHRTPLLLIAAILGGIALALGATILLVLVIRRGSSRKAKH